MKKLLIISSLILLPYLMSSTNAQDLIHYWHFNTTINNDTLVVLSADISSFATPPTLIYQQTISNVANPGYMDNVAGTDLNQRINTEAGRGIRPRNPSDSMELVINLPTVGHEDIKLSFATQRSGQGMLKQVLFYSTDGNSYTQFNDTILVSVNWEIKEFDFSSILEVNNNPNFKVKIRFFENTVASNGNNRFDNIVLEGNAIEPVAVTGIIVNPETLTLEVGETSTASALVQPINADNQNFTWSSSESNIATVNANGLITAIAPGTANIIATTEEGGFSDTVKVTVLEPIISDKELIYYWHFNTLETPQDVTVINADFSLIPNFIPQMIYTNPSGVRDIDAYTPGSILNLQMGENEGKAARVRNPSVNRALEFNISTSGVSNVVFQYVVMRSGQGMLTNIVEYSLNGGETWTNNGLSQNAFNVEGEEVYQTFLIDFSDIDAVNNNDDFMLRIRFEGNNTAQNGNNRLDNITLTGIVEDLSILEVSKTNSLKIYPNPTSGVIFIKGLENNMNNQISVIDMNGKVLINTNDINLLNFSNFENGVYFLVVESNGKTTYNKVIVNK